MYDEANLVESRTCGRKLATEFSTICDHFQPIGRCGVIGSGNFLQLRNGESVRKLLGVLKRYEKGRERVRKAKKGTETLRKPPYQFAFVYQIVLVALRRSTMPFPSPLTSHSLVAHASVITEHNLVGHKLIMRTDTSQI